MECKKCGATQKQGAEVCHICQTPIEWEEEPAQPEAEQKINEKKSKKKLFIIGGSIIAIIAIVAVVLWFVRPKGNSYEDLIQAQVDEENQRLKGNEAFCLLGMMPMDLEFEKERADILKNASLSQSSDYFDEMYNEILFDKAYAKLDEYYGSDWKISYSVEAVSEWSDSELDEKNETWHIMQNMSPTREEIENLYGTDDEEIVDELSAVYDKYQKWYEQDLTAGIKVKVKYIIKGSKGEDTCEDTIDFVEIDKTWMSMNGKSALVIFEESIQ